MFHGLVLNEQYIFLLIYRLRFQELFYIYMTSIQTWWHLASIISKLHQTVYWWHNCCYEKLRTEIWEMWFFFSFRLQSSKYSFSTRSDAHFKAQSLALDLCYLRNLCDQTDMHRLSSNLHCNFFSFIFSSMNVMLNFNMFIHVSICYMREWMFA